ncbi:hypothetical protein SOCE26_013720 [Sorangium cellulosum]|uniref:Right handed beta helix domain-containing protein n=1 Tax=Sorangium cellulosum TaxID=56 RepID=A0A2L0EL14_SORCE|nr:right-handed parallel beta-helix repeat-containing protein [Sorangium cellulosum]AUX39977.1 hypothetical protein SOCE26_013720 [Sorangium cellulosum]
MANRFWAWFSAAMTGSAACATVAGCGGDETASATCPEGNLVRGVCAGVPAGEVCAGETCTEGAACTSVVDVTSEDELAAAAEAAAAGTCIALREGRYGVLSVPGGVSLLGRSAAAVEVQGVVLAAGEGAVVRGLTVGREGVSVQGATGVRIDSVRVVGERGHERPGVEIRPGSSIAIVDSEIIDSGHVGVFAVDADVTLERSVVAGAQRGGIVIQGQGCDQESCACASRPALEVKSSVIRSNHIIGVSLRGATASLVDVDVTDSREGDAVESGGFGGGISVAECSSVLGATKVRVLDSRSFGILVDHSTAALGDEGEDESIEISRNTRGLWIQNVCQTGGAGCVTLHNGKLDGNFGVGIGITGSSRSIILCKSAVTSTQLEWLPVFNGSGEPAIDNVGDGIDWLDGSEVTLEQLTLSGNTRQSLLIDGPASGRIWKLDVTGDAAKPPVQQNFTMGERPEAEDTMPTVPERAFPIPQSPAALSSPE